MNASEMMDKAFMKMGIVFDEKTGVITSNNVERKAHCQHGVPRRPL